MSSRIANHLSESNREFLKAINFIPPQPKPPEPLRSGWIHRDAKQLKCELERLLYYSYNGGK